MLFISSLRVPIYQASKYSFYCLAIFVETGVSGQLWKGCWILTDHQTGSNNRILLRGKRWFPRILYQNDSLVTVNAQPGSGSESPPCCLDTGDISGQTCF